MRTIPVQLMAHYKQRSLTLAKLWKITRVDGEVFGFTDVDINVDYLGVVYKAGTGVTPSAITGGVDFGVDNLNVDSVLSDDGITEEDLRLGKWDNAAVEIMEVNYENLNQGHSILRLGTIGEVKTGQVSFSAELRGLIQRLQTAVGRQYMPTCDADLGDARCTVNLPALKVTGTVAFQTSTNTFVSTQRVEAEGYFNNGLVTFTSGLNAGERAEIIKNLPDGEGIFPPGSIQLYIELPYPLSPGDTYEMVPGCRKGIDQCVTQYNNLPNFRGFPAVPGPDKVAAGT